jgi:hypothetical protein
MDEHSITTLDRGGSRSGPSSAWVSGGVAGLILLLGVAAAWFLTVASAATLATTSRVLLTTGLVGLVFLASVVVVRIISGGHDGGGGRPGGRQPAPGNSGAELFTVINGARLRPIPVRSSGEHARKPRRVA